MEAFALKQIAEKKRAKEIARLEEQRERSEPKPKLSKEEQQKLNKLFGVPDAPIGASAVGKGGSASVWWDLESHADVPIEPYITWKVGAKEYHTDEVLDNKAALRKAALEAAAAETLSKDQLEWFLETMPIHKNDKGEMPPVVWSMQSKEDMEHNTVKTSGHGLSFDGQRDSFIEQAVKVVVMDKISGITVARGEGSLEELMWEPPPLPPTPPDSDEDKPDEYIAVFDDYGQPVLDDNGEQVMEVKPRLSRKERLKKKIERMKKMKKKKKKMLKRIARGERPSSKKSKRPSSRGSSRGSSRRPSSRGSDGGSSVASGGTSASEDEDATGGESGKDEDNDDLMVEKIREEGQAMGKDEEGGEGEEEEEEEEEDGNYEAEPGCWLLRPAGATVPHQDWMEKADAYDAEGNPLMYMRKGYLVPLPEPGPDPFGGLDVPVQLYDSRENHRDDKAGVFHCRMRRERIPLPGEDVIPDDETDDERKARLKEAKRRKKEEKKRLKAEEKAKKKELAKKKNEWIKQGLDPAQEWQKELDKEREKREKEAEEVDPNRPTDTIHLEGLMVIDNLRPVTIDETIIGWEIHRYRKDRGVWYLKGSRPFGKLDKYAVTVDHLTDGCEYRFTVKARNRIGLSPESEQSNPVMVEQPLPAGWFRFYAQDKDKFYYANIKTRQSRWERPDRDPFFLEEWITIQFNDAELRHLKELYLEEMQHFDKVTVTRFIALMKECGEQLQRRPVTKLFRGITGDDESITTWANYMAVIAHLKKKKMQPAIPAAPVKMVYFLSRQAVASVLGDEQAKMGNWQMKFNDVAERSYYENSVTKEMRWEMPDEVRFYLPPKLEDKLLLHFNPGNIEKFRMQFSQIDVDGSGDISDAEMRILLESMGIHIDDRTFRRLITIVDLNGNGTIEFDEFCWMMYSLKTSKDGQGGLFDQIANDNDYNDGDDPSGGEMASDENSVASDRLASLKSLQSFDINSIGEGALNIVHEVNNSGDELDSVMHGEEEVLSLPPIKGAEPVRGDGDSMVDSLSYASHSSSMNTSQPTNEAGFFSAASSAMGKFGRRASMAATALKKKSEQMKSSLSEQSMTYVKRVTESVKSTVMEKMVGKEGKHGRFCFCGCRDLNNPDNFIDDD